MTSSTFNSAAFSTSKAIWTVGLWSLTGLAENCLHYPKMNLVVEAINDGLRRIARTSFRHFHELDLNFHRTGSKKTVFAVNRAMRSIDSGLRFFLGYFSDMVFEMITTFGAFALFTGKKYLFTMMMTFTAFAWYTKVVSKRRQGLIRDKLQIDKK